MSVAMEGMGRAAIFALFVLIGVAVAGPDQAGVVAGDPGLCGPFPKYYKEIIYNWMKDALVDADSAKIEWAEEPKPVDVGANGQHYYAWLVEFKVNARNRFGAYTGKQSHAAVIRDN